MTLHLPPAHCATRVHLHYRDPLVLAGLIAALAAQSDIELVDSNEGPAGCGEVVVADYESGLSLMSLYHARDSQHRTTLPRVLIVTRCESPGEIRHALEQGAMGYLILGCALSEVVDAVRALRQGSRHIDATAACRLADSVACEAPSQREVEVLRLVADGLGNKAIARQLDIAVGTVKAHLRTAFQKLGAASRTEAASVAGMRGLFAVSHVVGNVELAERFGVSCPATAQH